MWTASTLCMGMNGDTLPNTSGARPALGSGNVPCAVMFVDGPIVAPTPAQKMATANADMRFFMCAISLCDARTVGATSGKRGAAPK
jgi:hypothetical protein